MGVDSRRPPLPAPTDISSADNTSALGVSDDTATNISHRTDKTHWTIPEDGSPVTITTKRADKKKDSSTSLLIEYFEGNQNGSSPTSRPSLRVRVTPSASRRSKQGRDHIQISETNRKGRPSAVRRISLPSGDNESIEISSGSDVSSTRPPVEVEVLHDQTDYSDLGTQSNLSRVIVPPSDISSMPPDSLMDMSTSRLYSPKKRRSAEKEQVTTRDTLKAPSRSRSRSGSKERITQRVMEKLQKDPGVRIRESSSRRKGSVGSERSSRSRSVSKELLAEEYRSSKSRSSKVRDDKEPNLHPSEISTVSSRSAVSSSSINNPKLLNAVEDAIKKLILPELNAVKEEQRAMKNRQKFEDMSGSRSSVTSSRRDEERRVSKSSSLPSVAGRKPDIIADDKGVIHTEGSERRRTSRRSSRDSVSERSSDTAVRDSHGRRRSSGSKKHSKEGLMAGAAAAALVGLGGAAALKHHSSSSTLDKDRKKRRSKSQSRSRAASVTENHTEEHSGHRFVEDTSEIPPLPMQSTLSSDVTRDSLRSEVFTDRPSSRSSRRTATPTRELREVARRSPREMRSPVTRQSLKSPFTEEHHEEFSQHNTIPDGVYEDDEDHSHSGLAATGLGAAAAAATAAALHHRHSREHLKTPTRNLSPVQSDSSLRRSSIEIAEHPRVRSIRSTHSLSSERKGRKSASPPVSGASSPSAHLGKKRPDGINLERGFEILPEDEYSPETPRGDDLDQWLEREHAQNDMYRKEIEGDSVINSDLGHHRDTMYTDNSYVTEDHSGLESSGLEQDLQYVGSKPRYVHTPPAAESAVASLQDPSNISIHSSVKSSPLRPGHSLQTDTFRDREAFSPGRGTLASDQEAYQGPPESRGFGDSKQRWEAIRDRAMAMTTRVESPAQSETRSIDDRPVISGTYVPIPGDIPEIGFGHDDEDDVITNPSILSGKLGEGLGGMSSYEPTPNMEQHDSHRLRNVALAGTGAAVAAAGLGVAIGGTPENRAKYYQPSVEELEDEELMESRDIAAERPLQPRFNNSPTQRDEGYISAMSPIPNPIPQRDIDDYDMQFDDEAEEENPFMTQKHLRHESGLSHGMASPLYDSATGKGMDRIQSKDIIALMDHLHVRDGQKNAVDTEILTSLVRTAAEMRNNFAEMKRYIAEQDRIIMSHAQRSHDTTVQRVISGPRPMPTGSPRTPRRSIDENEDPSAKKKNVFRRAFKGLSMRSTNDLGKIEDMLMTLLSEVEGLKEAQALSQSQPPTQTASLNSYEHLRAVPDPGYEPEGRAGTNSSPAQSGHLSNPSSRQLTGMHSGYDARRGSDGNRISTVLEGDEDAEEMYAPRDDQYAVRSLGTPPKFGQRDVGLETPPEQTGQFQSYEPTPKTDKSRGKHKSGSSIFNKISRWSKTTASSVPDNSARNSAQKKEQRPYSAASRSGSNLDEYNYELDQDDRMPSQGSLVDDRYAMTGAHRGGSPLVPEDDFDEDDYDYDDHDYRRNSQDPKYQVHRNSQNMVHPQPKPGPTFLHRNNLESQAMEFQNPPTPDADRWGSAPTLAANRSRFSADSGMQRLSPLQSEDGDSQHSASEEVQHYRSARVPDDGPLVPPKIPFQSSEQSYSLYGVPMMNSGMHIASPLEPIEEVRKSLETDRSSTRYDMTPSPRPTGSSSLNRRPTGPRDMPRSGSAASKRKPVPQPPDSPVSYETYRTSLDGSETF
ncbi:hypothetical protein BT63DRAFT_110640 [Microthyrium microscopicum]|uniref:Uncharacterized protein n=1 Tax=Microthyrium microscopicum TaxID=703497 RepID=A0A6A6TX29_9PEZI|nr:hypothetical protein BT63DRAFT_110640 [Microthyrium microscopicum]